MQAENVPDTLVSHPGGASHPGEFSRPSDVSRPAPPPSTLVQILGRSLPEGTAFELQFPGEPVITVGRGPAKFCIRANSARGVAALKSLDEVRIAEAYMSQDLDLDGDLLAALDLRNSFADKHLLAYLWTTYGQRFFRGQTASDKTWISQHYDTDGLQLVFLDPKSRCYSHGYFESDSESLEAATQRKLATAFTSAGIQPGMRVLDIGAGWGTFTEFAGKRGAHVTSLTISKDSEAYCQELIRRENLPCQVVREHFLEYTSGERFDAIVNLGVTEHLPDYPATLAQYQKLVKPGGRVFLDACASRNKFPFSSFTLKYVWPGNATPLHLQSYLEAAAETSLELILVQNDRNSYKLTAQHWAENLERSHQTVAQRWGEGVYRRFLLYLWGCVHCFASDDVTAYHWMLQLSGKTSGSGLARKTPATIFKSIRKAIHL